MNTRALYKNLALVSAILTLATIILSAYLRHALAGLSCTDWPDCYGQIGSTDQYQAMDSFTDALPHKTHGVIRAAHRFLASTLGILVVLITFMALRGRRRSGPGIALPVLALGLTLFLSILGYLTPSPWIPAVALSNLLGAMALMAVLWWLYLRNKPISDDPLPPNIGLRPWARAALVIFCVQLALGGWASANFIAGCSGQAVCQQVDWSISSLAQAFDLFRTLTLDTQGRVVPEAVMGIIQSTHIVWAMVTFIVISALIIKAFTGHGHLRSIALLLAILLLLQIGLGMVALINTMPLALVTAHNVLASLLLLVLLYLNHLAIPLRQAASDRYE